ncbi:hypothetical protein [uncultured Mesonia sp.]
MMMEQDEKHAVNEDSLQEKYEGETHAKGEDTHANKSLWEQMKNLFGF